MSIYRNTPLPSETFAAGMFHGLMDAANGRTVHDYTEDEIATAWLGWLDEWRAEQESR